MLGIIPGFRCYIIVLITFGLDFFGSSGLTVTLRSCSKMAAGDGTDNSLVASTATTRNSQSRSLAERDQSHQALSLPVNDD